MQNVSLHRQLLPTLPLPLFHVTRTRAYVTFELNSGAELRSARSTEEQRCRVSVTLFLRKFFRVYGGFGPLILVPPTPTSPTLFFSSFALERNNSLEQKRRTLRASTSIGTRSYRCGVEQSVSAGALSLLRGHWPEVVVEPRDAIVFSRSRETFGFEHAANLNLYYLWLRNFFARFHIVKFKATSIAQISFEISRVSNFCPMFESTL